MELDVRRLQRCTHGGLALPSLAGRGRRLLGGAQRANLEGHVTTAVEAAVRVSTALAQHIVLLTREIRRVADQAVRGLGLARRQNVDVERVVANGGSLGVGLDRFPGLENDAQLADDHFAGRHVDATEVDRRAADHYVLVLTRVLRVLLFDLGAVRHLDHGAGHLEQQVIGHHRVVIAGLPGWVSERGVEHVVVRTKLVERFDSLDHVEPPAVIRLQNVENRPRRCGTAPGKRQKTRDFACSVERRIAYFYCFVNTY